MCWNWLAFMISLLALKKLQITRNMNMFALALSVIITCRCHGTCAWLDSLSWYIFYICFESIYKFIQECYNVTLIYLSSQGFDASMKMPQALTCLSRHLLSMYLYAVNRRGLSQHLGSQHVEIKMKPCTSICGSMWCCYDTWSAMLQYILMITAGSHSLVEDCQ